MLSNGITCSCYDYNGINGICDTMWGCYTKEMTRETTDLGDVGKVGALASLTQYHLLSLGLKYKTVFARLFSK